MGVLDGETRLSPAPVACPRRTSEFIRYIFTAEQCFSGVAGWSRERRSMDHADDSTLLAELGFYALAGSPDSARDLIAEVIDGERLGLGTCFISERYNRKEIGVLSGAAGAVSERIRITTAATNHNTRHPMVTAGMARTMQSLTGGRFVLGLGRGIAPMQDAYGIPRITTAQLEDFAGLMRRLFRGEVIIGHDGPAGKYPVLHLDASLDEYLPMGIVAFGENTLELAGRVFDEVVLHTYFTDETTARCVKTVKTAAEKAGRDPDSVRVWSCFATIGDHIPEDKRLKKSVGRLGTYLQGYGDLLVRTNGGTTLYSTVFWPTRWSPASVAWTSSVPPSSSSTSRRSFRTSGWRHRATGTPRAVRGGGERPVRPRL